MQGKFQTKLTSKNMTFSPDEVFQPAQPVIASQMWTTCFCCVLCNDLDKYTFCVYGFASGTYEIRDLLL